MKRLGRIVARRKARRGGEGGRSCRRGGVQRQWLLLLRRFLGADPRRRQAQFSGSAQGLPREGLLLGEWVAGLRECDEAQCSEEVALLEVPCRRRNENRKAKQKQD